MSIPPGRPVTVREILFEGLRAYCAERGLHDGGQVTLLEADPREVLIRNPSGTMVRCPAAFARFVDVVSEGGTRAVGLSVRTTGAVADRWERDVEWKERVP